MHRATSHIAIDLGAESGRVMLGRVDPAAGRIALEELHRFRTHRVSILGSQRWDVLAIYNDILAGLTKAAVASAGTGEPIHSVSVTSWGVDYVLYAAGQPHLAPPFMYRDSRTEEVSGRLWANEASRQLIFEETGIQFLHFNTLYQLLADLENPSGDALHALVGGLLPIADYFNYLLSGVAKCERSLASTTQLYNPRTCTWSDRLVDAFALRRKLLPCLVDGGTTLGMLTDEVAHYTGLGKVRVIAACSHDTAGAVAGTPLVGESSAYLSSGTWSLLGMELREPVVTNACRELGFTNEVGYGGTIRLLKNIGGLFLVQECRQDFAMAAGAAQEIDYATLAEQARTAKPLRSLIRPELPQFGKVSGMTRKIADYCRQTGQPAPETPGQFVRCIFDSLGLLYARTLGELEQLVGRRVSVLNIVGGGSRSELLNQIAADACGLPVEAGPVEATSLGCIGIQAIAAGTLGGLTDLRALVRRSFPVRSYTPSQSPYASAMGRFLALPASDVA